MVRHQRTVAANVVVALHGDERKPSVVRAFHQLHHVVKHALVRGLVVAVALHQVAELQHEAGVGRHAVGGRLQ